MHVNMLRLNNIIYLKHDICDNISYLEFLSGMMWKNCCFMKGLIILFQKGYAAYKIYSLSKEKGISIRLKWRYFNFFLENFYFTNTEMNIFENLDM